MASLTSVRTSVLVAAIAGCLALAVTRRIALEMGRTPDFTPSPMPASVPEPAFDIAPESGPVMVTIAYQIDPARAEAFSGVMQRTRRARLRQGALSWGLFRDTTDPGRFVEYFVDENWLEHQRRLERFTAFDAGLRDERMAFHLGPEPPVLRRYLAEGEGTDTP